MFGHHHQKRHSDDCRMHGRHRGEQHFAGPRGRGFGPGGPGWSEDGAGFDPRFGRGGGRKRMFDGGELRLILLSLIADRPRYGYDLIRAIEERTNGAYAPSPGIVYPTLTMLAEMGLIAEQSSDGARKIFKITSEGTAHLAENAKEVAAMFARLDEIGAMRERTDAVPVRRAMHNLKSVLLHRLGEGLDKDKLHAAVELIDEAARKIERL